jgi:plastocyanin
VLVVATSTSCERAPSSPSVAPTPTPLDAASTGTLEGHVLFAGAAPPARTIVVTSDPTCAASHPNGLVVRDVDATNGRLAEAFVAITKGLEDRVFAVPAIPVEVDQRGCSYEPRVAGVQAGQPIRFRSSDDTLHNVHGEPRASSRWNFGLPRRGSERTMTLTGPEIMVPVRCDVHPWMRLDVGVLAHPFFAVTGGDGAFRFPGVPRGQYVVTAWHATLGRQEQAVTLEPGQTATLDLRFDGPKAPASP